MESLIRDASIQGLRDGQPWQSWHGLGARAAQGWRQSAVRLSTGSAIRLLDHLPSATNSAASPCRTYKPDPKGPFFLISYVDDTLLVAVGRSGGIAMWERTTPSWELERGVM